MRISFIMPGPSKRPIGGYKVIYEYANRMLDLGHEVNILHPAILMKDANIYWRMINTKKYFAKKINGGYHPRTWFALRPEVNVIWAHSLHPRWVPESDVVIATSWHTAEWVLSYPNTKGRKFYLIHDYEYYMTESPAIINRMAKTYHGLFNIATSPAVQLMLSECGATSHAYIPNSIDNLVFSLQRDVDDPGRNMIGFPARSEPFKGTAEVIVVLEKLKSILDVDVKIWAYGPNYLTHLPSWVEYYSNVDDRKLCEMYNKTKIFLVPSYYEGWGLPGAESMACGAALVTTDNVGVRGYAKNGETALFSNPKDIDGMVKNLLDLLNDDLLRIKIAKAGNLAVSKLTWESAVLKLQSALSFSN